MQKIIAPLHKMETGEAVANLQDALGELINGGKLNIDPSEKPAFLAKLDQERSEMVLGDITSQLVQLFNGQYRQNDLNWVDDATADALNGQLKKLGLLDAGPGFVVRGQLLQPDGTPMVGARVAAFDKDLRTEEPLGEALTDQEGCYEISYTASQFSRAEKGSADLQVRVLDEKGAVQVASAVRFNAPVNTEINLEIKGDIVRPLSEYERFLLALQPVLQDIPLAELTDEDIDFLAGDTGIDRQYLVWLVQAARLAAGPVVNTDGSSDSTIKVILTHLPVEKPGGLQPPSAPIFYGLFRQGQPVTLEELSHRSDDELAAAVSQASDANRIPVPTGDQIQAMKQFFGLVRAANVLKPSVTGSASVGDVLRTIPDGERLTGPEQLEFARLHAQFGSTSRLWDAVNAGVLAPKLPVLQRSLALQSLTMAHAPLMAALQARHDGTASASLDYLAALSSRDWLDLAFEHGAPNGAGLSPIEFAEYLERSIEDQYPTAVLRERLRSETGTIGDFPAKLVGDFLGGHPDFDLRQHDVDTYFDGAGIVPPELRDGLKQLKRVWPLTGRYDATAALLGEGLTSHFLIAKTGYDQLRAFLGNKLDDTTIRTIFTAASESADTSLALSTLIFPQLFNIGNTMIPPPQPEAEGSLGATLRNLFGDLDFGECRDCQSVLGPAAYLTDLLHFMETSPAKLGGSVLDALLARRPDLLDLELSCENANTEIPYIDLVLEILENAVAFNPPLAIPLTDGGASNYETGLAANPPRIPDEVLNTLRMTAVTIGEPLTAQNVSMAKSALPPRRSQWIISDGSRRWSLSYQPRQMLAWRISQQGGIEPIRKPISLPSFDALSEIETALRAGSLHAALLKQFAPDPVPPIKGTPLVTPTGETSWNVSLCQEVQVEVVPGKPKGVVNLYQEGHLITPLQLQFGQCQLISSWLDGTLEGLYANAAIRILGLPPGLDYTISHDAVSGRYLVQVNSDLTLSIAPEWMNVIALTFQNSSIHTNLAGLPENRNPQAYRKLRQATFPWTLPLDLWTEEIRAFLIKLGVPRQQLFEIAQPSRLRSDFYTAESLGISPAEFRQITQPAGVEPWAAWGLAEQNNAVPDTLSSTVRTGGWLNVLTHVSMLMQQSRLSYREVLEMLQTSCGGIVKPAIQPSEEANPSKLQFSALDPALLDWIHRFTRLRRRLGWSARELDRALAVFDNAITADSVYGLALMRRLNQRLYTPLLSLSAMLGYFETQPWTRYTIDGSPVDASLYERQFQPSALRTSSDNSFFHLNAAGELNYLMQNPSVRVEAISDHAEFVASCLGIKPTELGQLSEAAGVLGISDEVQLTNLGALHGIIQFIRGLALSVDEFLRWQRVLDRYPFKRQTPDSALPADQRTQVRLARAESLLDFVDNLDFARQRGQSLEDLEYLLRHEAPTESLERTNARLLTGLASIRSAIHSGEVLGKPSYENLLHQLELAGVPPSLVAGLRSDEGLVQILSAEIGVAPLPQTQPVIPQKLRAKFYFTANPNDSTARFGCRGTVSDQDFADLAQVGVGETAVSAASITALQSRYTLVRGIVQSQLQNYPVPVLKSDPIPAPSLGIPNDFAGFLSYSPSEGQLQLTGLITVDQRNALKAALPDLSAPFNQLFARSQDYLQHYNRSLLEADLAYDLVMTTRSEELILGALRDIAPLLEQDLLATQVAAFTGLDQNICAALLNILMEKTAGAVRSAQDVLFDKMMLASDASLPMVEAQFSAQLAALAHLDKAALLLANTGITRDRLDWLTGGLFEVIDINSLPAAAGQPAASFAGWRAWCDLLLLVRSMPGGLLTIDGLVAALNASTTNPNNAGEPAGVFAQAYNLPDKQIRDAYLDLLEIAWPADFRKPDRLLQLARLLNLLVLGLWPSLIQNLLADEPDEQAALSARGLFLAQFDSDTALQRLEPVSNALRPRQRDALVDYLRAVNSLVGADELLDYYLIDVQMEACMRTSRIKQAISSAQLFIQRCLLNLERVHVAPADINAHRYEWMKNNSVWVANRKVFLYPENWIEPELRDDKTEIFKALESDLLQEDLTHESALTVFRQYLEKASDIARPVIVSLWDEGVITGDPSIVQRRVHIVARDRSTPYKYFYRAVTLTTHQAGAKATFAWRPWELIEGDLASGHVLVCALDGSPYIVCPSIQTGDENKWNIHLQLRKRGPDGWKAQKESIDALTHAIVPGKDVAQSFVFVPAPSASSIRIDCFGASVASEEDLDSESIVQLVDTDGKSKFSDLNDTGKTRLDYDLFRKYGNYFYIQIAEKLKLRVIEKYTDTTSGSGTSYYRIAVERQLTVTATIECDWYDSSDDILSNFDAGVGGNAYHDEVIHVANDPRLQGNGVPPSVGGALPILIVQRSFDEGQCLEDNPHLLLDYFSVADAVRKLNLPPWLKCIPKRVHSIMLSTQATSDHVRQYYESQPILLGDDYGTGSIRWDLQIELKPGKLPATANPSRGLSFSCFGSFEFDEARSLSQSFTPAGVVIPPLLSGCEFYCSGYRSLSAPAPFNLNGQTVLASGSNTPFVFAPLRGGSSLNDLSGAYSDSLLVLYFLQESNRIRAVPEGQYWLWNGMRALAGQRMGSINLAALPESVSGPNAIPIHYGQHVDWIDLQRSPQTLDLAFDQQLPASLYNWEVFFHIPLLIATQLSQEQRFEDARRWFHTIFDPTSNAAGDNSTRYWRFKPFQEAARGQSIDEILAALANGEGDLNDEIEAWKDNPFNPHLVARFRIRAYQWTVVIKYIQNLLDWGDQLFRRDTIESINEATQLYVLAARILGARPASNPRTKSPALSYRDLAGHLDDFSNKWIALENARVFQSSAHPITFSNLDVSFLNRPVSSDNLAQFTRPSDEASIAVPTEHLRSIGNLFFCIPQNDFILSLWSKVDDRLFNIRHCMNIDGVERPLPLFDPPIDPALLVRATAAGLDLAAVLNDLGAPLPLHRFIVMLQKSLELSGDLRSLGGSVLAALEKKDAEELALLRSTHEMTLLDLTELVRKQQILEAKTTLEGLHESRKTVEERYRHYQHLLGMSDIQIPKPADVFSLASVPTTLAKSGLDAKEQGLGMSQTEQDQLRRLAEAQGFTLASGIVKATSGVAFAVGAYFDTSGTVFKVAQSIGHSANVTADALQAIAGYASAYANRDYIIGGYERRRDEWIFQSNMALRELIQIDQQTTAAEIRVTIAEQELTNTYQQISNAQEVDAYLRSKYSGQELYRFMSSQLLTIYFRTYQLVFELAKRAERCFGYEMGLSETSFIKPGYWDSVHKGLLAGEQLHLDLRRLELAYLEQNKREYEMTRHVSVLQLDPMALILLRQTGKCELTIPEAIFDLDFPGHYLRRIKMVTLTIPCVTGPYIGVACTLTLLKSEIRHSNAIDGGYLRNENNNSHFTDMFGPVQSIVTSSAQNDSGLFEPNLRDERYLPFEGAGVASTWRIELPNDYRQFDYDTISDVILHIRYTAREGGSRLKQQAVQELQTAINNLVKSDGQSGGLSRVFSLRHEFPNAYYQLLHPASGPQTTEFTLSEQHFPYFLSRRNLALSKVKLILSPKGTDPVKTVEIKVKVGAAEYQTGNWSDLGNNLKETTISLTDDPIKQWTIDAGMNGLNPDELDDVLILLQFGAAFK